MNNNKLRIPSGTRKLCTYAEITFIILVLLLRVVLLQPPGIPTKSKKRGAGTKATGRMVRTAPPRVSMAEDCDYYINYCMKAYKTGIVCGRTIHYQYANFTTYCELDYINCMERYEVWQLAHMGECFEFKELTEYIHYQYNDDDFLDRKYVSDIV